jgi:hypothetical protein
MVWSLIASVAFLGVFISALVRYLKTKTLGAKVTAGIFGLLLIANWVTLFLTVSKHGWT